MLNSLYDVSLTVDCPGLDSFSPSNYEVFPQIPGKVLFSVQSFRLLVPCLHWRCFCFFPYLRKWSVSDQRFCRVSVLDTPFFKRQLPIPYSEEISLFKLEISTMVICIILKISTILVLSHIAISPFSTS